MGSALKIGGAKGGESKPRQPYKAPDSALSIATAKMLYIISEGEIAGPADDARSFKLDGTPLIAPDGSEAFPGTTWEFRSGSVDQEHIAGFPAAEYEQSAGLPVELRSDVAWTRAITNRDLSAVRVRLSWPQIWEVKTNGDQVGYRIDYAIELSVDGGAFNTVLSATLDDKGTTEYERSHRVDLPQGFNTAVLRVRRLTPNRNDSNFADVMRVKALTEVIDAKLRYPNLALAALQFDASQFSNIPKFSLLCRGRIIKVPNNYDPVTRTYTGSWDGTFKLAYSNNPAWVWYDLLLHRRYGLGRRITADMVDRWSLYEIGRYCDVMVPDGKGGMQPRMTTNVYIQDQVEGYALLSDLASVFRGSSCWNGSKVTVIADIPGNDDGYVFTRSNIVGEFEYGAIALPDRHTRAKISWDNPANEFKTEPTAVTNDDMIGVLGHRMLDVARFACTVEGEAIRHGIWALKSEQYETWTVRFTTGMEGRNIEPGQIIGVADELLSGRANGGRISAATARVITLDFDAQVQPEDRLIVNLPSGKAEGRIVKSVAGRQVTVMADYSELPEPESAWSIESADLGVMRFRVNTIEPKGMHQWEITGVQHEPDKFDAIDHGARVDPQPITVLPPGVIEPPESVAITSRSVVSQGIAVTTMRISWPAVKGAVAYDVEWRKDNGSWLRLPRTGTLGAEVEGIYSGVYQARVSAVSVMDVSSVFAMSALVDLKGKEGLPPAVAFLTTTPLVYGTGLAWGFPAGAEDTERTEIWQSATTNRDDAIKLGDFAYPQAEHEIHGLAAGVSFFYWARLVDRSGNIGPWYPTGVGVNGQSSSNRSEYEEYFKDKISNGALYPALRQEIELISGPPSTPGSVNARIQDLGEQVTEITDQLGTQITQAQQDLQQQIDTIADLADSMPYKLDQAYTAGQGVLGEDGKLYQAKVDVPAGNPPPNATFWTDIGQAVQTANGLAARVTTVETKVTEQDGKLAAESTRIDGVQSSLATTNQNVNAAQQAAQDAATLAGGKGKVIVQSAAPAAADRLAQNLWIDTTGNANTPKRWNGSAWSAVTDKVATDAAAAAANALSVAQTKADATVVDSLSSKVTQQGDTIASQGQALVGMQNSLTTTNQNVTGAQQAAQAAADAAGAKGKVLYQSTAPAVADRLAQNLWIDTTGNANTPKRWNGTAWVTVTDKVATDAAAAAASALAQVATKAEASALQSLDTEVKSHGTTLTSQGAALTQISNQIGNVGGDNLLANSSFEELATASRAKYWNVGATAAGTVTSMVDSPLAQSTKAQRVEHPALPAGGYVDLAYGGDNVSRPKARPGAQYALSVFARGTPGVAFRQYLQFRDAAGAVLSAPVAMHTLTADYGRFVLLATAPADTVSVTVWAGRMLNGGSTTISAWSEMDNVQFQEGAVATAYAPSTEQSAAVQAAATQALQNRVEQTETGLSSQGAAIISLNNKVDAKADAAALQALSTSVASQGTTLTSQGANITELNNQISNIGGDNLLANSSFDEAATANRARYWLVSGAATATLVDSALPQSSKAQRVSQAAVAANAYIDVYYGGDGAPTLKVRAGGQYALSVFARGTPGQRFAQYIQFYNASGTVIAAPTVQAIVTGEFTRYVLLATAPAGAASCRVYAGRLLNMGSTAADLWMEVDNVQLQEGTVATAYAPSTEQSAAGQAAALQAITTRVEQNEAGLSSQGSSIINLENSLTTTNQNVSAAQQAAQAAATAAGAKGEVIYGTAAPAADKRLAQNLWIDTTGNANTPKRWNGSAWVAVTDKVATDAAAAAANALSQVATKAEASVVQGLSTTVGQHGTTLTSQGQSITELRNTIGGLGAGGLDAAPGATWQFDTSVEGWAATNATLTAGTGSMTITATANDPNLVSPIVSINGALYSRIKVKITRRAGAATDWDSSLFYQTAGHGFSGSYIARAANPNIAVGESAIVEWDMANLFAGGNDWVTSTVTRLRIDIGALSGGAFEIDWIAVGRLGPGASAAALQQVSTNVTQQGEQLTAQASRLDGLYVQVNPEMEGDSSGLAGATGGLVGVWTEQSARVEDGIAMGRQVETVQAQMGQTNASVQQVSEVVAGVDGKVSAISSWKTETNASGKKVATGIIQGSDGTVGEILLSADRVAIINGLNGPEASLFVFQDGQLFLNSALINQAFIQSLVVGMTLRSQAVNAQGLPLIEINLASGSFTVRGQDANGSTLLNNGGLYVYDANGIERTAVGRLT